MLPGGSLVRWELAGCADSAVTSVPVALAYYRALAGTALFLCRIPGARIARTTSRLALATEHSGWDRRADVQLQLTCRTALRGVRLARLPSIQIAAFDTGVGRSCGRRCAVGRVAPASVSGSRLDQRFTASLLVYSGRPVDGDGIWLQRIWNLGTRRHSDALGIQFVAAVSRSVSRPHTSPKLQ